MFTTLLPRSPGAAPKQYYTTMQRLNHSTLRTSEDSRRFADKIRESQGSCRQGRLTRSRRAHNANANVVACGSAEKRCTWIDEIAFLPRARVPVACSYPAHALGKHSRTSPSSPVGSHYSDALHALSCTWSAKLAICSQSRSDPRPS